MPIQYELFINHKTSQVLGLEVPPCCPHSQTRLIE